MRRNVLFVFVIITVYVPVITNAVTTDTQGSESLINDIANLSTPQSYLNISATDNIANLVTQIGGGSSDDSAVFNVIERELGTITEDLTTIIAQDEVSIEALVEQATKLANLALRLRVVILQRELKQASDQLGLSDGWVNELLSNN